MTFVPILESRAKNFAIGRNAVRALHIELLLYPKPGLVSPIDTGAHDDMNAESFFRSLFALRHYFSAIAQAGAAGAPFPRLQRLGIDAERRMLRATKGVNTHRGAIFCLGLLAAAAGWRQGRGLSLAGKDLAATILDLWGDDIASAAAQAGDSHGAQAMRLYGARGAREEALAGYPILMDLALPTLQSTLRRLDCPERASVQCLFTIMAQLQDTNLLHRGGAGGLSFVQESAQKFLDEGGVFAADWRRRALALHGDCVALHLSPGGAADCLAAAWFVHLLQPR
jgi:triphosphoribosyl-dephospho-CoA synthase